MIIGSDSLMRHPKAALRRKTRGRLELDYFRDVRMGHPALISRLTNVLRPPVLTWLISTPTRIRWLSYAN